MRYRVILDETIAPDHCSRTVCISSFFYSRRPARDILRAIFKRLSTYKCRETGRLELKCLWAILRCRTPFERCGRLTSEVWFRFSRWLVRFLLASANVESMCSSGSFMNAIVRTVSNGCVSMAAIAIDWEWTSQRNFAYATTKLLSCKFCVIRCSDAG